jgi:hypothetical protein
MGWLDWLDKTPDQLYREAMREWNRIEREAARQEHKRLIEQTFSDAVDAYNSGQFAKAAHCYLDLASQGDIRGELNLAYLYMRGEGVPFSSSEALTWALAAANRGSSFAMWFVGRLYCEPQFGMQDFVKAEYWLAKALDPANQQHVLNICACADNVKQQLEEVRGYLADGQTANRYLFGCYNILPDGDFQLTDEIEAKKYLTRVVPDFFGWTVKDTNDLFTTLVNQKTLTRYSMPEPIDWIQSVVNRADFEATVNVFCGQRPFLTSYVCIDPSPIFLQTVASTISIGSSFYGEIRRLKRQILKHRLCLLRTLYEGFDASDLPEEAFAALMGVEIALASAWFVQFVPHGFECT